MDTLLFFGVFNPPTLGHASVIKQALKLLKPINGLMIIPADQPVWEKPEVASFSHRVAMLRILISELSFDIQAQVQISAIEYERKLSGKTIETLAVLGEEPTASEYALVLGADALQSFDQWVSWETILSTVPVYIVPRSEFWEKHQITRSLSRRLATYIGERIHILAVPEQDERWFSSTQSRKEIKVHGKTVQVSPGVAAYIEAHQLYR